MPTAAATSVAAEYTPRRPETTVLYGVVQQHLESWIVHARSHERSVPRFVERELRRFLECGIFAHGFLRVHCDACKLDRLVPFSCKGRGFCPSCGGRQMADTAAHLVDHVLPRAPVRQWVLSLPFGLRYRLAYDRELTAEVLRLFLRAVFASLRRRSRGGRFGTDRARCGAVSFIQRFGGALNLNVHFHALVLDGTYRGSETADRPRFHPVPPPTSDELDRVLGRVIRGIARLLVRRGLGNEPDDLAERDPLLAQLLASAVQGRAATGPRAGQRALRFGDRVEIERAEAGDATPGLSRSDGFSLHAAVAVPANDRRRLERLCRYVGRPPIATERLRELPDGRLLYELRHRWRDGTTHVAFEPLELIDRLAALVPPPRFHTVRYHGVLASRSKYRAAIVPGHAEPAAHPPPSSERPPPARRPPSVERMQGKPPREPGPTTNSLSPPPRDDLDPPRTSRPCRYYSWPELMRRVFDVDVLRCPRCSAGPMRILAAIHPPTNTRAILQALGLPTRAPPLAPPRVLASDWTLAEPRPPIYAYRAAA